MARTDHWLTIIRDELARGRVDERPLVDAKGHEIIHGLQEGPLVTVNPIPATLDTLIHELFHRAFPGWPEAYVRARTTELLRRLTDADQLSLYTTYCATRRVRRRPKVVR